MIIENIDEFLSYFINQSMQMKITNKKIYSTSDICVKWMNVSTNNDSIIGIYKIDLSYRMKFN